MRTLFFTGLLLLLPWTLPAASPPPTPSSATNPSLAPAAKGESTPTAEALAQAAEDKAVETAFSAWKAQRNPDEQVWLSTLETYLGSYYLPRYKREKLAGKISPFDFVRNDPALPRVLLIGDSVSNGYTLPTRALLAGRANIHRAPENCGPTSNGIKKLDAWLGKERWDIIHFNFGIHDRSTPIADYERRLDEIMTRLKATGATVIWASTTPIPADEAKKQDPAAIIERNNVGARLAKKHGIIVDDLYQWINAELVTYQRPNDVHFTGPGYQRLAERVATVIGVALPGAEKTNTALIPTGKLETDSYVWEERHAEAMALKAMLNPEIVLIGDSITHFWGGQPEAPKQNRGKQVWDELFGQRRVLNLGFGWDRTQNVLKRIQLGELDGIDPKLIVLHIGTNNTSQTPHARANTPEEIVQGIAAIIDLAQSKCPHAKLVLMAIFPRGRNADDPRRAVLADINQRLAEMGKRPGVIFVDTTPHWLQPDGSISPEIMRDAIHPTNAGYQIWAAALKPLLPD